MSVDRKSVASVIGVRLLAEHLHHDEDQEGATDAAFVDGYIPLLLVQWGLLLYVARVGRSTSALGALLGQGWKPRVARAR